MPDRSISHLRRAGRTVGQEGIVRFEAVSLHWIAFVGRLQADEIVVSVLWSAGWCSRLEMSLG